MATSKNDFDARWQEVLDLLPEDVDLKTIMEMNCASSSSVCDLEDQPDEADNLLLNTLTSKHDNKNEEKVRVPCEKVDDLESITR